MKGPDVPSRAKARAPRLALGIAIWAVTLAGAVGIAVARGAEIRGPATRVLRFAVCSPRTLDLKLESAWDEKSSTWINVKAGDPLLSRDERAYVGCVIDAEPLGQDGASAVATPSVQARIALDPEFDGASFEGATYRFAAASGDVSWILETLLPEEKRAQIRSELSTFAQEHSDEIASALRPIGEDVLEHAMKVLDENLGPALKNHEAELQRVLDKHQGTLKEDVLPVLKRQLGPMVKERAKPVLTRIGRELWDALPVWSLGVSALRDKLPWQSQSYMDKWWEEFLETKAIPILKEHEDELVKTAEDLVQEGIRDPKVRAAFAEASKKLSKDPEFKSLVRAVLEEALVRPFDVRALVTRILDDPVHRGRLLSLEQAFGPTLQRIGRIVSIDQTTKGLSPDLARVLRRVVFSKDQRWVAVGLASPLRRLSGEPRRAEPARRF